MKKLKAYITWEVEVDESEMYVYQKDKARIENDTKEWLQEELGSDFKITLKTEIIEGEE